MASKSIFLLVVLLMLSGCRGCQLPQFSQEEKAKSERLEKQPPARLELTSLQTLPSASDSEGLLMKPGHWYEMHQSVRANEADEALLISCSAVERAFPFRAIPPAGLRESIIFDRPISLARGQKKRLALEMLFPRMADGTEEGRTSIRASYLPRMLGAAIREEVYPVTTMPEYQYYFVALSQNPSRFQFLNGLTSVIWPEAGSDEDSPINPFRVIQIAQSDAQNNLPTRLTTWTSTSHLMWNDCDASALLEKQQESLIDWLHFGGQLIVNGPESQASLKNSFLSKYLPLENLRGGKFDEQHWQEFSRLWTIARYDEKDGIPIQLPTDREPPSIDGELASGANWVRGCEGLVAERFIGSGRIVMTTFSLGESMMVRWPSFSSFFNGALMYRPSREWKQTIDKLSGNMMFAGQLMGAERDPSYVSRVRLMGRDFGTRLPTWQYPRVDGTFSRPGDVSVTPAMDRDHRAIHNQGVAQMENESVSGFGKIAMKALQKASGIQVPRLKTIIQLLVGYLVVLVPLNWLIFHAIGRVEFAWLAAPFIAIVGAVVIARSVQLDIGFSRSQTTFNLLELKSGYPRGHLSSYASLYTSLSTNYQARYQTNDGILLPVNAAEQRLPGTSLEQNELRYLYAEEAGSGLQAYPVRSNSTSFLKGEEIHSIGGAISLAWDDLEPDTIRYRNASNISLSGVGIVAKTASGHLCNAWIGELDQHTEGRIRMVRADVPSPSTHSQLPVSSSLFENWGYGNISASEGSATSQALPKKDDNLEIRRQLAEIAKQHPFDHEEAMLLGSTDDPLSQLKIEPLASQHTEATIVVVRLNAIDRSEIGPDVNLPSKVDGAEGLFPLDPDAI